MAKYKFYDGTNWVELAQATQLGSYLPLSGGTLTGNLSLKANQYDRQGALNCNNSDIMGVNSIYTQDTADNTAEGIRFYRDSTHWDSFTMSNGNMYFMPNDGNSGTSFANANIVLHSGNIAQYAGAPVEIVDLTVIN